MHKWKYSVDGRMAQVRLRNGADLAALKELDNKAWLALSCPVSGVRFDLRTLELLDTDKDGRIRTPEVIAAIDFLLAKGVDLDTLFKKDEADERALADLVAKAVAAPDEERLLRYKLHLVEFLENFVNMRRLYDENEAMFQTGVLRMDSREMNLCFHVEAEEAHSALVAKSKCCVLYVKLVRPSEGLERMICAVVTAGKVGGLYAGRNGVFYDRDGKDWEATVTNVVEAQVSLVEAFWSPWRKIGEGIAGAVQKFLGDRQSATAAAVAESAEKAATGAKETGGATTASGVAAIGIGVGMVTAAFASLMAAISHMTTLQLVGSAAAVVLLVSLPSVILTWFKLRSRDLGAILNASGWAVNRPLYFSMRRARAFTRCASDPFLRRLVSLTLLFIVSVIAAVIYFNPY